MITSLFTIVSLVIGAPDLLINWSTPKKEAISIVTDEPDKRLGECLQSGFQVRYRFEMKLCRSRAGWFAQCRDPSTLIRTLEYDAISETYKLVSDLLSDKEEPSRLNLPDKEGALKELSKVKEIPLEALGAGGKRYRELNPLYVSVRFISDCKGEYNQTWARIGYFLSLGLFRFNEHDSGWTSFTLDRG